MIDRDTARVYLQRRVTEHDLGVANGADMDPDVVALSAIVLAMDEKLDEIANYFEQSGPPGPSGGGGGGNGDMMAFFEALWAALLKNKAALGALISAAIAFFISQAVQFFEIREFFGLTGLDGLMLFLAMVAFIVAMFVFVVRHSHSPRR